MLKIKYIKIFLNIKIFNINENKIIDKMKQTYEIGTLNIINFFFYIF